MIIGTKFAHKQIKIDRLLEYALNDTRDDVRYKQYLFNFPGSGGNPDTK